MSPPAYHLRPNKAADRFALVEAIRRLERLDMGGLTDYVYCGLGGPYLEDFRLLYDFFPELAMVSIEYNEEIYKRQQFHLPCKTLELVHDKLSSYITQYDHGERKSIFWLDYTGLEYTCFEDFQSLLDTLVEGSMLKITLRSEPRDYWQAVPRRRPIPKKKKADEFRAKFGGIMPDATLNPPRAPAHLASLVQDMLQIATDQVLQPTATDITFLPVSSFYYSDGTVMFTLTGIVCERSRLDALTQAFGDWEFSNLNWSRPKQIDVPVLSTKERLHLQHLLPSNDSTGKILQENMGYLIEDTIEKTETALEQYAAFHRYSPYFMRAVP